MKYRPEIDGLRSFAVVPVVLFHAGFTGFSGGFVGVDIFFVISGYLIARIILSEMQRQRFSYADFYERRIRRILPALAVVVFASLVAALLLALPDQVSTTARSGIFALLGVSNIFFWTESGYFAPASEYQMLLHTWSLGVEEQFYLFLPPVLYLIFRFRLGLKPVLALGLPMLFLAGLWLSVNKPSVAFYLLPARAWELSLGVALAAGLVPKSRNPALNGALALAGLIAIVASIFLIDSAMIFPGWAALLPCLGAAAVIHAASGKNLTGRLLSLPPLRFIGLISYSLYLWHWPVLVTLRLYRAEQHLSVATGLVAVALAVALAALTWKFVEAPFRSRSKMPFRRVLAGVGGLGGVSAAIAAVAIIGDGFPNRLNETTRQFIAAADDIDPLRAPCQKMHALDDPACRFGAPDAEIDFVVVGDSHAAAIRPAVEQWAKAAGRAGTLVWDSACPLLVGARRVTGASQDSCTRFTDAALPAILEDETISTVFVAGRWEAAYSGIAAEIGGSYRMHWIDADHTEPSADVTKTVIEKALARTGGILEGAGKEVFFLGAVPDVGFDVPRILALASHNQGIRETRSLIRDNTIAIELDAVFERVAGASAGLRYVSIWQTFCAPDCAVLRDGVPLYSDDDHITHSAARDFLGPVLTARLLPGLAEQRTLPPPRVARAAAD